MFVWVGPMKGFLMMATLLAFVLSSQAKAAQTEEEKQIVREGQKVAKEAEKRPPPSKHMQDKMQSTFSDVEPAEPQPADKTKKPKHKKR